MNAVPWSVIMFSGIPYVKIYSSIKAAATRELGLEVTQATGHLENRSTPTSMYFFFSNTFYGAVKI